MRVIEDRRRRGSRDRTRPRTPAGARFSKPTRDDHDILAPAARLRGLVPAPPEGSVDERLRALGLERKVPMVVQDFLAALHLLARPRRCSPPRTVPAAQALGLAWTEPRSSWRPWSGTWADTASGTQTPRWLRTEVLGPAAG